MTHALMGKSKNIRARHLHLLNHHFVAHGWKLSFLKVTVNCQPLRLGICGLQNQLQGRG